MTWSNWHSSSESRWFGQRLIGSTLAENDSTLSIHCLDQVEYLIDYGEGEDIAEGVYEEDINN